MTRGAQLLDELHHLYRLLAEEEQNVVKEVLRHRADAIGKMKQFASWFTHGVPGGAHLRKAIYESKSPEQVIAAVDAFFQPLVSAAALA